MSLFEFLIPLVLVILIVLPLVKVFRGHATKKQAKTRLYTHISLFFMMVAAVFVWQFAGVGVYAITTTGTSAFVGSIAQGLGLLGAALATGFSALGAGIAVAGAAPAAIGAFSEDEKNFGKSLIFVALGEGVAIYGLIISIIMINSL